MGGDGGTCCKRRDIMTKTFQERRKQDVSLLYYHRGKIWKTIPTLLMRLESILKLSFLAGLCCERALDLLLHLRKATEDADCLMRAG